MANQKEKTALGLLGLDKVDGRAGGKTPLSTTGLARLWDQRFGNAEIVGELVDFLLERRHESGKSNGASKVAAFDEATMAAIAEHGFYRTLADAPTETEKSRIERLYQAMLEDETLILEAQATILYADTLSPFWEEKMFSPAVVVYDLAQGQRIGMLRREKHVPPAPYRVELAEDELVATIGELEEYGGRKAMYALRLQKDVADLLKLDRQGKKSDARSIAKRWKNFLDREVANGKRGGEATVGSDGVLRCRVTNRPKCGELKASVLVVGLMEPTA